MSSIVKINNQEVEAKEFRKQRVVTFKDIDTVHQRVEGTSKRNFLENKDKLIEGEDYYILSPKQKNEIRTLEIPNRGITVLTESGYLMLVKSLNDDLAWQVQRQLVKIYFRNNITIPKENNLKEKEVEAKLNNSRVRMAQTWLKIAALTGIKEYKEIASTYAANTLANKDVLQLPKSERKTYSATDIGQMFGVSSSRIGKTANANNLKTPEYGQMFYDKSRHSCKEVETWRYYDSVIPVFAKLLKMEVSA